MYVQNALNTFGTTPFVVCQSPGIGHYSTVQAAIDAAFASVTPGANQTVVVNGSFVENITFRDSVNVIGLTSENETVSSHIDGNHIFTSAIPGSTIAINGIELSSSNATATLQVLGTAQINLNNCSVENFANGPCITYSSTGFSDSINVTLNAAGGSGECLQITSTGSFNLKFGKIQGGSASAINMSGGGGGTFVDCDISAATVNGTVQMSANSGGSFNNCGINCNGVGKIWNLNASTAQVFFCQMNTNPGGTASAFVDCFCLFFECIVNDFVDISATSPAQFISLNSLWNDIGGNVPAIVHVNATFILAKSIISSSSGTGFYVASGGAGDAGTFFYAENTLGGSAIAIDPLLTTVAPPTATGPQLINGGITASGVAGVTTGSPVIATVDSVTGQFGSTTGVPLAVYFSAYLNSNLVVDATEPTFVFQTVASNVGSGYNNSTGAFTAPTSGLYYFSFAGGFGQVSDSSCTSINGQILNANSSQLIEFLFNPSNFKDVGNNAVAFSVGGAMFCNSGDVVTVSADTNAGSVTFNSNSGRTSFSGFLVGP